MTRTCETCKWRSDDFTSACTNGKSERRADFVSADDTCEQWEGNKMDKLEIVLAGLECCINTDKKGYPMCEKCPYADVEFGTCDSVRELMRDAMKLLKKPEEEEAENKGEK